MTAGKDDLAREALRRKRDNEENSAIYTEQLGVQTQAVAKLKDQLRQLEAKYQTTLGARDTLIARQRRARAQRQVAEAIVVFTPLDPSSELDRMERKIRSEEAHAMAALEVGEESFESAVPGPGSRVGRRGRAGSAQEVARRRRHAEPHLGGNQ